MRLRTNSSAVALILAAGAVAANCTRGGELSTAEVKSVDLDGGTSAEEPAIVDRCTGQTRGATIGSSCSESAACDDGCFCNGLEQCADGRCVSGTVPCPRREHECLAIQCDELLDRCVTTPQDDLCSDRDACNGKERCDPQLGCVAASPLYCNDENSCTVDRCDTRLGCQHAPRDLDGDGFVDVRCGGLDCDDDPRGGGLIFPGASELCHNRRDDDCDGLRDFHDLDCAATNDRCADSQVIPASGSYSGSTVGLRDDYEASCASRGTDAVFRIVLSTAQDLLASVAGAGQGASVSLRPWARCEANSDLACDSASAPSLLQRGLPAGEYALIVQTQTPRAFELRVDLDEPTTAPPVDVCRSDTVDISNGGSFSGRFADVAHHYDLSCAAPGGERPDAAYRLVLAEPQDVRISANTSGSERIGQTVLSLVEDCGDPDSTRRCSAAQGAELRLRSLAAGSYYVLLESSETDARTWNLQATVSDPVTRPPGDGCAEALNITSAEGSAAADTVELDFGTSCSASPSLDRDAVFFFDLLETRDVVLETSTDGSHSVSLSSACGFLSEELRCRRGASPLVQSWRSLAPGRYFVTVATRATTGSVRASVRTGDPSPVPPNDRCTGAIDVSGGYSSRDTLSDFADDVEGCGGPGTPDAFYRIALDRSQVLSAIAVGDPEDRLTVTLRQGCNGANLACDSGAVAALDQNLPAGTYILVVESFDPAGADFELRVFLSDPL